jgi:hypothetical protein
MNNRDTNQTMTASQRLAKGQKAIKPAYLIDTIEELIAERDQMEANWDESMRTRMQDLARISITKFSTRLSEL